MKRGLTGQAATTSTTRTPGARKDRHSSRDARRAEKEPAAPIATIVQTKKKPQRVARGPMLCRKGMYADAIVRPARDRVSRRDPRCGHRFPRPTGCSES